MEDDAWFVGVVFIDTARRAGVDQNFRDLLEELRGFGKGEQIPGFAARVETVVKSRPGVAVEEYARVACEALVRTAGSAVGDDGVALVPLPVLQIG